MDFWGFVWFFLWTFVFIAYLMVLFSIIGDLFTDHTLNGWWKAVWIIFLIFAPFITALVYLIARGRGMAERKQAQLQTAQKETDNYIRTVASSTSPAEQITHAKALLDSGAVTQAEFDTLKAKALAS
jgi:type VI protein secretion system component VasK